MRDRGEREECVYDRERELRVYVRRRGASDVCERER